MLRCGRRGTCNYEVLQLGSREALALALKHNCATRKSLSCCTGAGVQKHAEQCVVHAAADCDVAPLPRIRGGICSRLDSGQLRRAFQSGSFHFRPRTTVSP